MWNSEARDSSPIIFYINEFMGEDQDAAAAREEGGKTELVEESRCWIGWAGSGAVGLAVEQSLRWGVHSPTRLDGKEQGAAAAPPGRRGTRGIRATKSTAVEELAPSGPRGVREITLPPRMVLSGLWPGDKDAPL